MAHTRREENVIEWRNIKNWYKIQKIDNYFICIKKVTSNSNLNNNSGWTWIMISYVRMAHIILWRVRNVERCKSVCNHVSKSVLSSKTYYLFAKEVKIRNKNDCRKH